MVKFRFTLIVFVFFVALSARAEIKDLDDVGATYPVAENDIVAEMREQAKTLEPSEKLLQQIRNYQPANLQPLPRATADRSFTLDPTYTLDHDLKDKDGNILYQKGYAVNPFDRIKLASTLCVIDGADTLQVEWFKKSPYMESRLAKLLLTGGLAKELRRALKRPVFYLTKDIGSRLKLSAVPSVVVQKGRMLEVTEFSVNDKNNF